MTYQASQIQSMISEIDRILRQTQKRRFWTIFRDHSLHRQILERCRNFLVMQQRPSVSQSPSVQLIPATTSASPTGNTSMEIQREMTLEIQRLRQEVMTPLRSDVAALNSERRALQEEVQMLMLQKAQLQADCETARLNLAQTLPIKTAPSQSNLKLSEFGEADLARLQALRDRTDFLLNGMDVSLQQAFTSLQKTIDLYQANLHNGLDRMHHLGYQGEVLCSTLVHRLAQQTAVQNFNGSAASTPSPMEESIDFFFADFDAPTVIANPTVTTQSPSFTSSQDLIPQQGDVIFLNAVQKVSKEESSVGQVISDSAITLESLFDFDELAQTTIEEPQMTLADIDELFADIPAL